MYRVNLCCGSILFRYSSNSRRLLQYCAVLNRKRPVPPPTPPERLKNLRRAERHVAIFAGVSLLIGYFALKKTFSNMASKVSHPPSPRPLVIAGPSGSGKSTLLKKLFDEFPDELGFSISHTSRKPRDGEKNGREYHFSTREAMQESIKRREFIESAEYSGNLYGTSKKSVSDVQAKGRVCVLDIDIQGVHSVKDTNLNPIYVFIQPPSEKELERRLRSRNTETEESLQKRLTTAKEEMKYAETSGSFDYIIINDDVDTAYTELRKVIVEEIETIKRYKETNKL